MPTWNKDCIFKNVEEVKMICSGKLQDDSKSNSRDDKGIGFKHAYETFEHDYFIKRKILNKYVILHVN